MKKNLLIILALLANLSLWAEEGIVFETGTWAEVMAKAKAANKPIFIDVYTSWCGPCKKMAKEVFTQKEVAERFNADFINYKIDAEKGEGISIAKQFRVSAYPTYLFVNGDGMLVYRSMGSMPAEKFISEANLAKSEFKDPMPLAVWEDQYEANKQDKAFVWNYLQKRKKLRLNSADILDQYITITGGDELMRSDIWPELNLFQNLNTDGPFYHYLLTNRVAIKQMYKDRYKQNVLFDQHLLTTAKLDVERAVENRDEKLLATIDSVLLVIPPDDFPIAWRTGEANMRYFAQTNDPVQLQKIINVYGPSVVGYDTRKIRTKDSLTLDQYDKDIASGKIKSPKPEELETARKFRGSSTATSYAYKVRDICKAMFNCLDDKKQLSTALQWIDHALQYSDNFTILETKAGLLYKSGRKKEGIATQQACIENYNNMQAKLGISSDKITKRLNDNMLLMKEGKPTWGLDNTASSSKVSSSDIKKN